MFGEKTIEVPLLPISPSAEEMARRMRQIARRLRDHSIWPMPGGLGSMESEEFIDCADDLNHMALVIEQ